MRSSAMAERAWTSANYKPRLNFLPRLIAHEKLMNRRGIPTTPITTQQCEDNIHEFCKKADKDSPS